jgi:hypothetical protein
MRKSFFLPLYWKPFSVGIFILLICLIPAPALKKIGLFDFRFEDLIIHSIMFLVFSGYLFYDLSKYSIYLKATKKIILTSLIISFSLAVGSEILQLVFTFLNRSASLMDLAFDILGTSLGVILILFIKR